MSRSHFASSFSVVRSFASTEMTNKVKITKQKQENDREKQREKENICFVRRKNFYFKME